MVGYYGVCSLAAIPIANSITVLIVITSFRKRLFSMLCCGKDIHTSEGSTSNVSYSYRNKSTVGNTVTNTVINSIAN